MSCCTLDISEAFGTVEYPGQLPCTEDRKVSFNIEESIQIFQNCETGFDIVADIKTQTNNPSTIELYDLFLEFSTISTENMKIVDIITPSGFSYSISQCNNSICPASSSGTMCNFCSGEITYSSGVPHMLSHGDRFTVILRGANGTLLEDIHINQAAVLFDNATEICVPGVGQQANFLPKASASCVHCADYSVSIEPFDGAGSGTNPDPACEHTFSVMFHSVYPTNNPEKVVAEITFHNPHDLDFEVIDINCNNTCVPPMVVPPGATQIGNCVYVQDDEPQEGMHTIHYEFCPMGSVFNNTEEILFNVRITSPVGCLENISFTTNTEITIAGEPSCMPLDITTGGNNKQCVDDCPGTFSLSGKIVTEHGLGVEVPEVKDAAENILSGIIVHRSAAGNDECGTMNIQCAVTPTDGTCSGNYESLEWCAEDSDRDYLVIEPYKDINPTNGVTTFDIIQIQKHILALELLDSEYKKIAANANNDIYITNG